MIYETDITITENNVLKFEQDLNALFAKNEDVIIDMKNTKYISSAALRVLVMLCKSGQAKGKKLKIVNAQPLVEEVFIVTGLDGLLNLNNKKR